MVFIKIGLLCDLVPLRKEPLLMKKMRKRLSILLYRCMLLQNVPVMAFAAESDDLYKS